MFHIPIKTFEVDGMNGDYLDNTVGNLRQKNGADEFYIEIDFLGLMYRLLDRIAYIIMATVAGAVIAVLITAFLIPDQYTATSKLYVLNAKDSAINLSDLQIGNYLASDYKEVFSNRIVHERVIENLNLPYDAKGISKKVNVSNPADTRILYITATTGTAEEARDLANEYAHVAREFIASIMDSEQPNVFENAVLPTNPSSPSKAKNAVFGALISFFIVCAVITVRFCMDDRIRNADDVEKYIQIATLGMLPIEEKKTARDYMDDSKKGIDN